MWNGGGAPRWAGGPRVSRAPEEAVVLNVGMCDGESGGGRRGAGAQDRNKTSRRSKAFHGDRADCSKTARILSRSARIFRRASRSVTPAGPSVRRASRFGRQRAGEPQPTAGSGASASELAGGEPNFRRARRLRADRGGSYFDRARRRGSRGGRMSARGGLAAEAVIGRRRAPA